MGSRTSFCVCAWSCLCVCVLFLFVPLRKVINRSTYVDERTRSSITRGLFCSDKVILYRSICLSRYLDGDYLCAWRGTLGDTVFNNISEKTTNPVRVLTNESQYIYCLLIFFITVSIYSFSQRITFLGLSKLSVDLCRRIIDSLERT